MPGGVDIGDRGEQTGGKGGRWNQRRQDQPGGDGQNDA